MADRDSSRTVFSSSSLRIGEFRCPPFHPAWSRDNRTDQHLVVFPRVGVRITHAGGDPIIADPNSNCDGSTAAPALNVNDFICFQNGYAQGCP